jgi:hypothetical protein
VILGAFDPTAKSNLEFAGYVIGTSQKDVISAIFLAPFVELKEQNAMAGRAIQERASATNCLRLFD